RALTARLFSPSHRRHKTRHDRRPTHGRFRPRLESLEARQLLTVSGSLVGDTLHVSISGADTANLAVNGSKVELPDSANTLQGSFQTSDVNVISVFGTAPNETVSFNSDFKYANLNVVGAQEVSSINFNNHTIAPSGASATQNYGCTGSLSISGATLTT